MKKILLIAIAATFAFMPTKAQSTYPKNEIGVYYGFASLSSILKDFRTFGKDKNFWGPIGVEYYYHISPVIGLGAVASIASTSYEREDMRSYYYSVMPAVKFNWLRRKNFGLYSGVAAGLMIAQNADDDNDPEDESSTETFFTFQATALGLEVGKNILGFAEIGFGEKGMICAGLRYKF